MNSYIYRIEWMLDGERGYDSGTVRADSLTSAKLEVLRIPPFGATVIDYTVG